MSLRQYDSVSCRIIRSNFPNRRQIQEKEKLRGSVVVVEERVARQRHHLNAKELGRKAGPTPSQTCGSHVQLLQRNKAVRRGGLFFNLPPKNKKEIRLRVWALDFLGPLALFGQNTRRSPPPPLYTRQPNSTPTPLPYSLSTCLFGAFGAL